MPTNFPAQIDGLANPPPGTALNDSAYSHSAQHVNANDAIEALQAKVGIDNSDNSEDTSSIDYLVAHKVDQEAGKGLSSNDYTDDEKTKLAGIDAGANAYTHPAQHSPLIIAQNANNRFVTDAEKEVWSTKLGASAIGDTVAPLVDGVVPSVNLPSYVDDVIEAVDFASLPTTGESGKIYVLDTPHTAGGITSSQFRWSGSAYAPIIASPGTTDAVTEGSTNLYFTVSRVRSVVLTGLSLATNAAITAADTILSALGKLQKQITDLAGANTGDETAETIRSKLPAKSIVILSSGQSNMPDDQAYSWSPAPNLYLWNFSAKTQLSSEVGTAFVPVSSSLVGPSVAAANVLAMENPQAKVYVINIFLGGMGVLNWGPSPDAPPTGYNFRQAISGNVPIALAAIGRSDIDYFVWGGGESDANSQSQTFSSDFETWIATWLKTQSWYAPYTPIYLLSMSPYVATSSGNGDFLWRRFNNSLRAIAAADPSCRSYIDTDDFPISLFDPSAPMPYLHRTPEGHFRIGEKLGRSIVSGVSEPIARMDNKEGTYTPIFSDLVNVTTITLGFADWVRSGNLIDVTLRLAVRATTAGLDTSFKFQIPVIAHAFPSHVSGLFQSYYGDVGIVAVVPSSQNVSVNYVAKNAVLSASCITFRYRVKDSDALPNPP